MAIRIPASIEEHDINDPADSLKLARYCEQAERYEDMCKAMKILVDQKKATGAELNTEERNLLSVAYKNVVGSKRASWRTLGTPQDDSPQVNLYRQFIEDELEGRCQEVLTLLKDTLIPSCAYQDESSTLEEAETKVFYLKMAGDYYRYLAEFRQGSDHGASSIDFYQQAMKIAQEKLEPTHPTRLGLALNLSVCYYEIQNETDKATQLAKEAFDEAIAKLDGINDQTYKDSTLIMQLLRDNLTLWTTNADADE